MTIRRATPPTDGYVPVSVPPPTCFSFDLSVSIDNAYHDRIAVNVSRWSIVGANDDDDRAEQFEYFRDCLPDYPIPYYDSQGEQIGNCTMFKAVNGASPRANWDVYKGGQGGNRNNPLPLFAGYMKAAPASAANSWSIYGDYSLNLMRYCMFQNNLSRIMNSIPEYSIGGEWLERTPQMVRTPNNRRAHLAGERELVESDNTLIGGRRYMGQFTPAYMDTHLSRYLDGFMRHLNGAIEYATENSGMTLVSAEPTITLKDIETFFEWRDPNPLARMMEIERTLRTLTSQTTITFENIEQVVGRNPVMGDHERSPCIKLFLRAGVRLKVYAKTTDRIRFEVVHNVKKSSAFRSGQCNSIEEVLGCLHIAKIDATEKVRDLFQLAQTVQPEPMVHALMQEFIWAVIDVLGDTEEARTLTEQIAITGRIVRPKGSSFFTAIKDLKTAGILRQLTRRGNDFVFVPTDRFATNADAS